MGEEAFLFELHGKGVGSVIDDLEPINVSNFLNLFDRAGIAVAMDGHDRGGLRRDRLFNPTRVEVAGLRVDIDEHRLDIVPQQRMRRGDKRIGRGDDFAGDPQGLQGGDQGDRTIGKKGQVLDTKELAQCPLELLMKRSVVGERLVLPNLL